MTHAAPPTRIWAVVPAAGMSRRMGRPKQLLPVGKSTMAARVVTALLDAGVTGLVIVTREELLDALGLPTGPRVHVAFNEDTESEMIDSIRIGITALKQRNQSSSDGILVVPADMPLISSMSFATCLKAFVADPQRIVVASHEGRRGHPIIFPASYASVVDELKGGLRELLDRFPGQIGIVAVDDPGSTRDVNTPAEYDALDHDGSDRGH